MKISVITLFFALVTLSIISVGCVSQPETLSPTNATQSSTTSTSQPTLPNKISWDEIQQWLIDGRVLTEKIEVMVPEPRVWLSPSSNGQPVRVLTDAEKENILRIANAFKPIIEAKQNSQVLTVDPRDYIWKSFINENAVMVSNAYILQSGISQALAEYMGDECYPGVFLIFRTQYERYIYIGIYIMVDLEQQKVVYVDIFTKVTPPSGYVDPYLESHNIANPLNSNYDPVVKYGPEGSRFGPPWDRDTTANPTSQVTPTQQST
jgi:hypothetical protein